MRRGHLFLSRCALRGARGGSPPVREYPSNRAPEFFGRSSQASETVNATGDVTKWPQETLNSLKHNNRKARQPCIYRVNKLLLINAINARLSGKSYYHNSSLSYMLWDDMTYVVREVRSFVMLLICYVCKMAVLLPRRQPTQRLTTFYCRDCLQMDRIYSVFDSVWPLSFRFLTSDFGYLY